MQKRRNRRRRTKVMIALSLIGMFISTAFSNASLSEGYVFWGSDWVYTLAHEKELDLSSSGLNIVVTQAERNQIRERAKAEFYDTLNEVVRDVTEATAELNNRVPLKLPDGSYNPAWDAAWDEFYGYDEAKVRRALDDSTDEEAFYQIISRNGVYDDLRAALFYRLTNFGSREEHFGETYPIVGSREDRVSVTTYSSAPEINDTNTASNNIDESSPSVESNPPSATPSAENLNDGTENAISGDDSSGDIIPEAPLEAPSSAPVLEDEPSEEVQPAMRAAAPLESPALVLNNKVGSVKWHRLYDDILSGNKTNLYIGNILKNYVDMRYNREINKLLKSKIGNQLNVKFNFYAETIKPEEKDAYGIGKSPYSVQMGKLSQNRDRALFSTVDFGGPNQATDEILYESISSFITGYRNGTLNSLNFTNGDELVSHLIFFDQATLMSSSLPFVQIAGYFTSSKWPYKSATRGEEDLRWNAEDLIDYDVFNNWSFTGEIPLTGDNQLAVTGVNLYHPKFDGNGKLISVSKPLMNMLGAATFNSRYPNSLEEFRSMVTPYGPTLNYLEDLFMTEDLSGGNKANGSTDIRRYKLVEDGTKVKMPNGSYIQPDQSVKILDVTDFGIMIFDSLEEADDYWNKVGGPKANLVRGIDLAPAYFSHGATFNNKAYVPPKKSPDTGDLTVGMAQDASLYTSLLITSAALMMVVLLLDRRERKS